MSDPRPSTNHEAPFGEQHIPPGAPMTEPANPQSHKSEGHSRRVFLFKLSLFLNGIVGAVLAVPVLGYLLGPALKKTSSENSWISLGPLSGFPEGETRLVNYRNPVTTEWDGQTGDVPCWVRRVSGETFQVFAINCAHLGCPVRWFSQSHLFLCPCHGGAYYADGSRASGPPERGLFEYDHKIDSGNLMIHAGRMPTLANSAKAEPPPLVQIDAQIDVQIDAQIDSIGSNTTLAATPKPAPRCSSCPS